MTANCRCGRPCAANGCPNPADGKYCNTHRSRLRRTGSLDPRPRPTPGQDSERFWAKVDRRADGECWPWKGTMLNTGYGQFVAQGRKYMAHRYAYEFTFGPIPQGLRSNAASAVNARKTQCREGHEYRTARDGKRFCPTCKSGWERSHRAKQKGRAA
jgi:hypothetical protein